MARCAGWCAPTVIYAIISGVFLLLHVWEFLNGRLELLHLLLQTMVAGLWLALLYFLCSRCYTTTSWVLLLLPIALSIGALILSGVLLAAAFASDKAKKHN